ncbi:MAG: M15 family peptidase, partial [Caulobacteraceae bacterium]|nr:M15 family peptidase [Caulobacteraceae bacterium]
MTLAPRSEVKLAGVHSDLVRVVRRADEMGATFHVTCGLRTVEEQKALV